MSFTDAFDPRFNVPFCEVHFWARQGRVMVINGDGHPIPMVTEVLVNTGMGQTSDATFIIALALAEASQPHAELFEHMSSGDLHHIELSTFKRNVDIRAH